MGKMDWGELMSNSIWIAYFSRPGNNYVNGRIVNLPVGNTEIAAQEIKEMTGGKLFKIDPVKKYSEDYQACTEEAKQELRGNARPELTGHPESLEGFDTIILAYPNWWGTMPMPVQTFLKHDDFNGKTILSICTHEGSGMGTSEADIRRLCPGANVKKDWRSKAERSRMRTACFRTGCANHFEQNGRSNSQ
jgi:flavodoxin